MTPHFPRLLLVGIVLLIGATVTVLSLALRLRRREYYYDVKADSSYDFTRSKARSLSVPIKSGSLRLAPKAHPSDSLWLAVRLRATALGHWFEPRVELDDGVQRLAQTFERGGAGVRYLNLSSLDASRETQLRIECKFLSIEDQDATLYYVSGQLDPSSQRLLIISPHPDDAEIAAFGLYSNHDSYVITVTAGEGRAPEELGAFEIFSGADAYVEKGRARVWNSITVPMLGGVEMSRAANLGYFDGTLQTMLARPGAAARSLQAGVESLDAFGRAASDEFVLPRSARPATWNNLVEDLGFAVARIKPDIIVTSYPRLDAHPDHKLSTQALIEALQKMNWNGGSLLLYTNHAVASAWYPFGPAGDVMSLPPDGRGVIFDGLLSVSLDSNAQRRKRVALDAMNDLRRFAVDSPRGAFWQLLQTLKAALKGDDQSYFRRAVRRNELFFEVKASSLYEPGIAAAILGETVTP